MKKILFIAITFCSITTMNVKVLAQTKIQAQPKIYQLQNPFSDRMELINSKRSNENPEKEFKVEVTIENNMEKGNMVKFKASGPVEKVLVRGYNDLYNMMYDSKEITTNYSGGTTTGIFYLDTPAYAGRKYYNLEFYAGLPDLIWFTSLQRKRVTIQQIPNNNLLKKIPND
jgi:hypothetical protein